MVALGGALTLADVVAVARGAAVEFPDQARDRVVAARDVIERVVASGETVYGVTTGFGSLADVRIEPSQAAALQLAIVRSHATAVGRPLSREEARAMLRHLALSPWSRWLDACAGGAYLSERAMAQGLPPARVSCDESLPFLRSSDRLDRACMASAEALYFPDQSFDAAACLAALHHAEDPRSVCRELSRVTRPGGRAALGDVALGSPAARFLNGFVDRHTENGHRGRFYSLEALADFFAAAGGREIEYQRAEIAWRFASAKDAILFCRDLFGLEPATSDAEVREALFELGAEPEGEGFRIPWSMHYVSATRE